MRAQDRWNKKAGYISKSYKVNQNIADDFASSCKEMGVSQSGELLKFMSEFIKKNLKGEKKMRVMILLKSRLLWAYGTCRSIKARPRLCSPPLRR